MNMCLSFNCAAAVVAANHCRGPWRNCSACMRAAPVLFRVFGTVTLYVDSDFGFMLLDFKLIEKYSFTRVLCFWDPCLL